VWIENPYDQHHARCMERDAQGHHTTHLDIKREPGLQFYPKYYNKNLK